MKRIPRVSPEGLAQELSRLSHESRDSLAQRWVALFGTAPPARTSRSLLMRAVAYKLQERTYGGVPASIRRMLLAEPGARPSRRPSRQASAGTVLLREWRGKTHQVTIGEEGVLYHGKHYRSLSEVARIITGSHWSGPAFFGLKNNGQG
jgi:hypothetical protein